MTTTKRDLTFLAAIFLGIAMAEPTLEKQFGQGLSEAEITAFYEIFGNNDQEGVSDGYKDQSRTEQVQATRQRQG